MKDNLQVVKMLTDGEFESLENATDAKLDKPWNSAMHPGAQSRGCGDRRVRPGQVYPGRL